MCSARQFAVCVVMALVFGMRGSRASGQECGSPVDFGIAADSFMADDPGADCGVVVQGDDVLTITNFNMLVFDREGNLNLQRSKATSDFFVDLGLTYHADPFCVFDPRSSRWFFLLLTSATEFGMAVSKSATLDLHDPDEWWAYEWNPPLANIDYPSMSVGEAHVFVTYAGHLGTAGQAVFLYIDKADLLDGGPPPNLTTFSITSIPGQDNSYLRDIGCVREYEEINSGYGYFITDSHKSRDQTNSMVRLYALNTAEDTLVHFDVTVPEYRSTPRTIPTPDGSLSHYSGHDFKWPIYRNGSLWAAHDIGVPEADECQVRWYEIKINGWPVSDFDPALEQSGTIPPPASGANTFHPAIHVDDDGNMAIAYNQSSSTQHPAIYRRIRKWYDDDGELRAPLLLKQSTGSPSGQNERWADFSCMEADPDDPGVMWSHLEWFEPTETRKTWLARTDLNKSLTLAINWPSEEIPRETPVTLTVTGAAPGNLVRWYYSFYDCGETYIGDPLYVTLEISSAVFLGSSYADGDGTAVKYFTVPANFPLGEVHVQAAELENLSENFRRVVIE